MKLTKSKADLSIVETNIDDCTCEEISYLIERAIEEGALDIHVIPCIMKKGRAGYLVRALTDDPLKISRLLISESTTLGVRVIAVDERLECEREIIPVEINISGNYETINIKKTQHSCKPEYEDVKKAAKKYNLPYRDVAGMAIDEFKKSNSKKIKI